MTNRKIKPITKYFTQKTKYRTTRTSLNWQWTRVLRKIMQSLFHMWRPSSYIRQGHICSSEVWKVITYTMKSYSLKRLSNLNTPSTLLDIVQLQYDKAYNVHSAQLLTLMITFQEEKNEKARYWTSICVKGIDNTLRFISKRTIKINVSQRLYLQHNHFISYNYDDDSDIWHWYSCSIGSFNIKHIYLKIR